MDRQQLKKSALNLALRPLRRAHGLTYRLIAKVEFALGSLRGPSRSFTRLPPTKVKDSSRYCALKADVPDAEVYTVAKMHRLPALERSTSFVNDADYRAILEDLGHRNPAVTHQLASVPRVPEDCHFSFEMPDYFAQLPEPPNSEPEAEQGVDPKAN